MKTPRRRRRRGEARSTSGSTAKRRRAPGERRVRRALAWPFRKLGAGLRLLGRGLRVGYGALSRGDPRAWDILIWVLAGYLLVIALSTLSVTHEVPASLTPLVAAAGVLPLLLLRISPFIAWGTWMFGGILIPTLFPRVDGYTFPWQVTSFLVLLALVFTVALRGQRREIAIAFGATAVVFLAAIPEIGFGWTFGLAAIMGVGVLVRWLIASRREVARQTEATELERARRAVVEERARIARDLHDVVAHRMSLVVVQAQSARYRLPDVTPEVAEEFNRVAEQAREALNEVRGMLGVLRRDDQDAEGQPQPGTEDVQQLLQETQRAGVDLTWQVEGDSSQVGPATAMVLYRVLQESLANASRHAPGTPVRVRLSYAEQVRLDVVNPLPLAGSPGQRQRPGHGIDGMHSRAEAVGGRVSAGPSPAGDFAVHLELPIVVGVA